MIREFHLADWFTLGNAVCGVGALFSTLSYIERHDVRHLLYACALVLAALVFDVLDGRIARWRQKSSAMGRELDSLADVISFGIAPALMMFFFILSPSQGVVWFRNIGWFVGFIYLLCAAMRLARFNVITNPLLKRSHKDSSKDFVGLPVPAAAGTVASVVLFLLHLAEADKSLNRWALGLPPLMLLVAFLMMSTVRYPSGKTIDLQTKTRFRTFIIALSIIGLLILYKEIGLLVICLGYIFFGLFRQFRHKRLAGKSTTSENSL